MSDEQRWIDQALAQKSELPAKVTISWEAYCRLVAERDEAQALAYECLHQLDKWDRNSWDAGDLDQAGDLLQKMRLLAWVQERLAKESEP